MLRNWLSNINWGNNFEFAYPWVLSFLLLLPFLIIAYRKKTRKPATFKVSTTHFIRKTSSFKTLTKGAKL